MTQQVYISGCSDYSGSFHDIQVAKNIEDYHCLKLMVLFLSNIWLETRYYGPVGKREGGDFCKKCLEDQ